MSPDQLTGTARERYDTWRRLGLSEAASLREVTSEGLVPADPFDDMASFFQALGLSEAGARHAAVGRARGEGEARRELTEAGRDRQVTALASALTSLAESTSPDRAVAAARAKAAGDVGLTAIVEAAAKRAFGAAAGGQS